MNFNSKYFLLFFLVHIHCFAVDPESKKQSKNSERQEEAKEVDSVTRQHLEVMGSALGTFAMDDQTIEFFYLTAPQEIRDFIEINQKVSDLKTVALVSL